MNTVTYQSARPGQTLLRVTAIRWAIAIIIPYACLLGGLMLGREWKPAGVVIGTLLGILAAPVATSTYLYKILGSAAGWVLPLILLNLTGTLLGSLILINRSWTDPGHPGTTGQTVITSAYWAVWACVLGLIALTVILAIVNGERWMQRNRYNLPRNKFEAYAQSRGTLAHLWLPR